METPEGDPEARRVIAAALLGLIVCVVIAIAIAALAVALASV